jgi:ferritin-like metal-binding protein YciE
MPDANTLQALFVAELRDSYDSEKQLVKALRLMAKSAQHPKLQAAFNGHLEETLGQVEVLTQVFTLLDLAPRGKHCAGTAGIVEEGGEAIEQYEASAVRDAALIGGGRRAEHYEIAAYTSLIAMAKTLGHAKVVPLLEGNLAQELAADKALAGLATVVNEAALEESAQAA